MILDSVLKATARFTTTEGALDVPCGASLGCTERSFTRS